MNKTICPNCGGESATTRVLNKYRYQESGLDNVWLDGGVRETGCLECKKKFISIPREAQLLQAIALSLLMDAGLRTGPELRFLRRACGLSQAGLAALLKIDRRATVAEREAKAKTGLAFAEEVGLRLILLKAFESHLKEPGNCALEPAQVKSLEKFIRFFHEFAMKVESAHKERIMARAGGNGWTVERRAA